MVLNRRGTKLQSINDLGQVVPEELMQALKQKASIVELSKRKMIYQVGDRADTIYIVKEGLVKRGIYSEKGRILLRDIYFDGHIFGESALFGRTIRNSFTQARGKVKLYALSIDKVRELINEDYRIAFLFGNLVSAKLHRSEERLSVLVFKGAEFRIVNFLYNLSAQKGQQEGHDIEVPYFFTHEEIAQITDTSRQIVTKILNKLRRDKLISFDRKSLTIHNMTALEAYLED